MLMFWMCFIPFDVYAPLRILVLFRTLYSNRCFISNALGNHGASERPRGMAAPSVMDAVKRDRKCPTSNIQYIRMLAKGIRQSKQKRTSVVRGWRKE